MGVGTASAHQGWQGEAASSLLTQRPPPGQHDADRGPDSRPPCCSTDQTKEGPPPLVPPACSRREGGPSKCGGPGQPLPCLLSLLRPMRTGVGVFPRELELTLQGAGLSCKLG